MLRGSQACSFPGENARSWEALGEARPGQSSSSFSSPHPQSLSFSSSASSSFEPSLQSGLCGSSVDTGTMLYSILCPITYCGEYFLLDSREKYRFFSTFKNYFHFSELENTRVFADDARGWQCPFVLCLHPQGCLRRPQGPCRVGTGESGLVLSEEGNPAGLSSCSGGLRPLVELCVEPAPSPRAWSPDFPGAAREAP